MRVEPEDGAAVERLARYNMRPQISLERMKWDGAGEVRYRGKAGHDCNTQHRGDPAEAIDAAELLARVIMHIPEPRRHLVRYYGWYSNVSRGKRNQLEQEPTVGRVTALAGRRIRDGDESPDARALRRCWAEMIKRVYEADPLVCPRCHGEMKIIAFIVDQKVVDRILRHLAVKGHQRGRGPPGWASLEATS